MNLLPSVATATSRNFQCYMIQLCINIYSKSTGLYQIKHYFRPCRYTFFLSICFCTGCI